MSWDFAEANCFGDVGGDFGVSLFSMWEVLIRLAPPPPVAAHAIQADARRTGGVVACVATDPPYYDNIGYADLSDFFYVWLRRSLRPVYPDLFSTMITPKSDELIVTPYRHGGSKDKAEQYFENGFVEVFARMRNQSTGMHPMTLFYAFKQTESGDTDGLGSTGWSTMLEGLLTAGWTVTATWPLRTEMETRMISRNTNALASSVVLACRPRDDAAGITDRQGFVRALQAELPQPIRELQKASIAPVDLRQAAIGPGMAVFSRYAKVVEPDSSAMRVRTALGLINEVLDGVLDEQEAHVDDETRWAIQWFAQYFEDEGPYGVAESLATAMNVSIAAMQAAGILHAGGGKVRLRARDEYPAGWDPRSDRRTPVWEATQHLVKRFEDEGESGAAALLALLGGIGDSCRALTYRLFTLCEKPRPALAGPYNALAASWTELQHRLAEPAGADRVRSEQGSFDLGGDDDG
jgi:putative DNA methylase